MEEPLYILQQIKQEQGDIDMEEGDSFWQEEETTLKTMEMDELVDTETPRFESLSVNDELSPKPTATLKRKRVGEDVFTRESVKQWQGSRIKAWENRYMVKNLHYYYKKKHHLKTNVNSEKKYRVPKVFIIDLLHPVKDNKMVVGQHRNKNYL